MGRRSLMKVRPEQILRAAVRCIGELGIEDETQERFAEATLRPRS
jgi:hypothetical protein